MHKFPISLNQVEIKKFINIIINQSVQMKKLFYYRSVNKQIRFQLNNYVSLNTSIYPFTHPHIHKTSQHE